MRLDGGGASVVCPEQGKVRSCRLILKSVVSMRLNVSFTSSEIIMPLSWENVKKYKIENAGLDRRVRISSRATLRPPRGRPPPVDLIRTRIQSPEFWKFKSDTHPPWLASLKPHWFTPARPPRNPPWGVFADVATGGARTAASTEMGHPEGCPWFRLTLDLYVLTQHEPLTDAGYEAALDERVQGGAAGTAVHFVPLGLLDERPYLGVGGAVLVVRVLAQYL